MMWPLLPFAGAFLGLMMFIMVLVVATIIFSIVMIVDNCKRKFKTMDEQALWLVMQMVFGFIASIVYYFVIYKERKFVAVPGKNKYVALVLSIFVGMFGIDRFYMGKVGTGLLKLFTFGGFLIWWIIDIILIATDGLKPKKGKFVKY